MEVYTTLYISIQPIVLYSPPFDRAAHAARSAAAPAQLAARDLDHLDALFAQVGVCGRVALVGDDHARLDGQDVAAVVLVLDEMLPVETTNVGASSTSCPWIVSAAAAEGTSSTWNWM